MKPQNLKKYFTTTISERRGTIVLLALLFGLVSFYWVDDWIYNVAPVQIELEELAQIKKIEEVEKTYQKEIAKEKSNLFQFDPNTLEKEGWQKLGFSSKQASSIIKFRKSGFTFYKKEDLKKLFVVDEIKYKQLAPFIRISAQKELIPEKKCYRVFISGSPKPIYKGFENLGQIFYRNTGKEYQYYSNSYSSWDLAENQLKIIEASVFTNPYIKKVACNLKLYPIKIKVDSTRKAFIKPIKKQIVNLNTADTVALKTLSGIGSYYASKIIKYRTKLGGFHSKDQLLEVYGIDPEILSVNAGFIKADASLIQKININTVTKEELKAHPYIKWNIANSIVLYRANHGKYQEIEGIKKSVLVNEDLYQKIKVYITIK